MSANISKFFMVEILERICPQVGATLTVEKEFGRTGIISFNNGKKALFHYNKFNLNGIASVRIAQDKGYTNYFLREFGYNTPEEMVFIKGRLAERLGRHHEIENACRYADRLGWPVYVKPGKLSQGALIEKAYNDEHFSVIAGDIFNRDKILIVQEECIGNDYRIIVLDDAVIDAYQRIPLEITGDGTSTISELINRRQHEFTKSGRDTVIPISDSRIDRKLSINNMNRDSIIGDGIKFYPFDVANLSVGGSIKNITESISPYFRQLALAIARDMQLRFCGIDLIASDATSGNTDYAVLEINSSPGLDNYRYDGIKQEEYTDGLYIKLLQSIRDA